ncbi:MAG: hypothetical protein JNK14_03355 [Chitinophagaceae bacterium]|nr:hypothetical protein [Chitinophagaceae bacterium]
MFRTISLTALLTGILDISAAVFKFYIDTDQGAKLKMAPGGEAEPVSFFTFLSSGGPDRIFKYIATGIFGSGSSISNTLMITWGIVFHFMIAFFFTAFLFIIYPTLISWLKNKFITGFLYGLFIWAVMNLVVLPLSHVRRPPFDSTDAAIQALILISMVGIPAVLIADNFHRKKRM